MKLFGWLALGLGLAAAATAAAEIPIDERRSGYAQMARDTQAIEDDDTANPGMLWVLDGEALWQRKDGPEAKSCADCHGAAESMKGVAARYPAVDPASGKLLDLEGRINMSRERDQRATPFRGESKELLALSALIGRQSRGLPIAIADTPETRPFLAAGRAVFERRQGQLNLSCALCHDDNWGKRLAGAVIPQGHPTGYPLYRLEWQALGSLQRRLRNCLVGMRAEAYPPGSDDYAALELFLLWRARGMPLETPAVRP